MTKINLEKIYFEGEQVLVDEHNKDESSKTGTLRGGSSGCIVDDKVHGKCARLSHMRSEGYQDEVSIDKHLMFSNGYANEDQWLPRMKSAWPYGILCEEEIPVVWHTENGTKVTGRPDMVLLNNEGAPELGIEHKLVCSPTTAYNVLAKGMPALAHLIQATHYAMRLGIEFRLVYTSRSNYGLGFPNLKKTWDTVPDRYFTNEKRFAVAPFIVEYHLKVDSDDKICYSRNGGDTWTKTFLTSAGITDYYEKTSMIKEKGKLGPRPENKNILGKPNSWKACDGCVLQDVCDKYEHGDYQRWFDESILAFEENK